MAEPAPDRPAPDRPAPGRPAADRPAAERAAAERAADARTADDGPVAGRPIGDAPELAPTAMMEALGGVRGLVDSALPATVFVLARLVTGSLTTAAAVALVSGLVLAGVRRQRGESLQQVGSGFFGLVIAVLVARATGTGEGFFLPGIITTALSGVAFLASLVLRRPAVGLALAAYDATYAGWRDHAGLRRACEIATAFWAVTFFVRAGVAYGVYRMPGDSDGLLLVVVNVVKWPLMALAAVLTVVLVKRSGYRTASDAPAA